MEVASFLGVSVHTVMHEMTAEMVEHAFKYSQIKEDIFHLRNYSAQSGFMDEEGAKKKKQYLNREFNKIEQKLMETDESSSGKRTQEEMEEYLANLRGDEPSSDSDEESEEDVPKSNKGAPVVSKEEFDEIYKNKIRGGDE